MGYFAAFLLLISTAVAQSPRPLPNTPITRKLEYQAIRVSNQGEVSSRMCAVFTEPEPKDTPNPVLSVDAEVVVDVVIAWDGLVYSPIIEADSGQNDRTVLRTVKSWRFRPALCNGAPTNTEVRIKFRR